MNDKTNRMSTKRSEDSWPIEEWIQRYAELEKLVQGKAAELNQKNRELEIEAALERVRAKAMAMRSSKDIEIATAIVFNELTRLGIDMERCGIALINETPNFEVWSTLLSPKNKEVINVVTGYVDTRNHPMNQHVHQSWKEKKDYSFYKLIGDEVREYYDKLEKQPGYHFPKIPRYPDHQMAYCFFFNEGGIFVFTTEELNAEEKIIFQRFAKVFEQTYTRFLDLQKAEAQVREVKIEAALERVRSRSMAMHKSEELSDVIKIVSDQLQHLGFRFNNASFVLNSASEDYDFWFSIPGQSRPHHIHVPYLDNPINNRAREARSKGLKFFADIIEPEASGAWHQHMLDHNLMDFLSAEAKRIVLTRGFARSVAIMPNIMLVIGNYASKPYNDDENIIIKRFATVFEQTYTRFLDLQMAEAQAREAQIETALERVRAKAMAMHSSKDISEATAIVFNEWTRLGIDMIRAGIVIFNEKTPNAELWSTRLSPNDKQVVDIITGHLNYEIHPMLQDIYRSWKNKKDYHAYELKGDDVRKYYELLAQQPDYLFPKTDKYPERHIANSFFNNEVSIFAFTEERLTEEEKQVLHRFSKVFSLTYRRYQDLIKAEAQAREAKIEAALERVRAKAMAMHSSNDISEATAVVFNELTRLGVEMERSGIALFNETPVMEVWSTLISPENKQVIEVITGKLNSEIHPMLQEGYKFWRNKKDFYSYELRGVEVQKYYDLLGKEPEYQFPKIKNYPKVQILNAFYFNEGELFVYTKSSISIEVKNLLHRFTKVFSLTYRRYLDIVKAEAQAREAQIETALERVRAKAMAMHGSKDISDATAVVFNELSKLGVEMERCGIVILNETPVIEVWSTPLSPKNKQVIEVISGNLDTSIHPLLQGIYKTWTEKKDFYTYVLEGEEVKKYYDLLEKAPEYRFPKIARYNNYQVIHVFYFKEGGLFVYTNNKMYDEVKQIFLRFTNVFSLTYRRYLDIVKAEAQAREAQIEAALERVRAKAMAMHSSKDISEATAVVFNELTRLGVEMERCGIALFNETPVMEVWSTLLSPENRQVVEVITGKLNSEIHPMLQGEYKSWRNKNEFFTYELRGIEVQKYYDLLEKVPGYSFPKIKNYPKVQILNAFFFKEGELFVYTKSSLSIEVKNILHRFTKVFSLTYRRYLDIVKAEAQAREAQIEAALERVRAKAMAMHNSEDLNGTISGFYRELEQFSITPRRCGLGLLQKESRVAELSTMNTMEHGNFIEILGRLKMEGHWVLEGVYDNWLLQKEYHPVLRGNEIKEYNQLLRPQVAFPEYPDSSVQYGYFFFFPEGGVYAWTEKEMKEDELKIYRKFTNVLSLTYKRYKELKDAEANAHEAVKRASLDRVRAEIASMRTMDDLQRITPIIWHELTTLNVPFVRCGVFIMNEETEYIKVYLSAPNGQSLAVLDLSFHSSELATKIVNYWRQETILKTHWNRKEFISWMKSMIEQGQVTNQETYQGAALPPESLHLHFVPFKQGMLYVGNTSPLEKEALELVKALAESFSIAYARYEDFRQLEAAKNQIEKTLTELKSTQALLIQSEKMASLGELTAGIAHEIQNPLNFVTNFSELNAELIDEADQEIENGNYSETKIILNDIRENEEKIKYHGKRAESIVNGMLLHSRGNSGKKELTDINTLADEYLRISFHGFRAKDKSFNAGFKLDSDESLPKISLIQQDIGRVLLNLINNAFYAVNVKAKENIPGYKPEVVVYTRLVASPQGESNWIEVAVKDNGPGIPEKLKGKIFQPFFTTKPAGQGTGLGLSLSYDIIKAHGGNLKVQTAKGEGTEFLVQIPA